MRLVGDIEADALLDEATIIHSLVLKDLETGEVLSCHDHDGGPSIREGLDLMRDAEALYFHNGVRYDYPMFGKMYPEEWARISARQLDTLVLAHIRFIHQKDRDFDTHVKRGNLPARQAGLHNLKAWGQRLQCFKGEYEGPWDVWSPEMQRYCEQDVEVTEQLILHLRKAGVPRGPVEMEHKLARYLFLQERNGWPFDVQAAHALQARLSARRETLSSELIEAFGSWYADAGETTPKRTVTRRKGYPVPTLFPEGATHTKLKLVEFKPSSRLHIAKVMQERFNWRPKDFTPSGQPKVDESVLEGINVPEARLLQEYLLLDKRLGALSEGQQAWLTHCERNEITGLEHIHHSCRPGPITHRMKHSHPNLAQVPAVKSPYGGECRALFTVPEGWVLMGADVSGLELRVLGHHMAAWDNGAYAKEVVSGDVHSLNQKLVGLPTRDSAKTFIYALIYGAGNGKLGAVKSGKPNRSVGKAARDALEAGLPALTNLTKAVKRRFRTHKFVRLIDGRRAYPRAEHSALNTLVQGNGAIACKHWVIEFSERMTETFGQQGWDGQWAGLGFIHDEIQIAVREDIAEEAKVIAVLAIEFVGEKLGFNVPLTGEAKHGANWKDTH